MKLKFKLQVGSTLLFLLVGFLSFSQQIDALEFQKEMNEKFKNPEKTPLSEKDLENFTGLDFFEIYNHYKVKANFVRTPAEAPFLMPTTTDRMPVYVKYGELYFSLNGKDFKLNVFQNRELISDPEYYDYLFLPFTDLTNGETTYTGGRYLDLRIPEDDSILLDFNKAYNPYCAYSGEYSCPIPPSENNLKIVVKAGVQNFQK